MVKMKNNEIYARMGSVRGQKYTCQKKIFYQMGQYKNNFLHEG